MPHDNKGHTIHVDVLKWKQFRVTGPLSGNPPATGGFPSQRSVTRSFDGFFKSAPEQTVEQTIETPVIWDDIELIMTSL